MKPPQASRPAVGLGGVVAVENEPCKRVLATGADLLDCAAPRESRGLPGKPVARAGNRWEIR